eukprot:10162919-Lingulodinium_polyedra.AAC.1
MATLTDLLDWSTLHVHDEVVGTGAGLAISEWDLEDRLMERAIQAAQVARTMEIRRKRGVGCLRGGTKPGKRASPSHDDATLSQD